MIEFNFIHEWKHRHCKYVNENNKANRITKEASDYRNNKMADYCEEMIIKAKDAYYNSDSPIIEDCDYDKFEEYLKILRPNSKLLEQVGIK